MIGIVEDRTIRLSFKHLTEIEVVDGLEYHYPIGTRCDLEEQQDGEWVEIASGASYLHPNDNFNKEVGRKLALERALYSSSYFAPPKFGTLYENRVNRLRRKVMWDAYHSRSEATKGRIL